MRVIEQPCYVLVNRPFSESSWIVDIFSRSFGRQALIAKGARRLKSKQRGLLLPFQPLLLSWTGKGEVPTLTNAELDFARFSGWEYELAGRAKICGFYCNELLAALIQRGDPHSNLFDVYQHTLDRLLRSTHHHDDEDGLVATDLSTRLFSILRDFELCLIRESGYGVSFSKEAGSARDIQADQYYEFVPKRGFVSANVIDQSHFNRSKQTAPYFLGRVIRSLSDVRGDAPVDELLKDERSQTKQIMRLLLSDVLGHKRIMSRDLFFPRV